MRLELCQTNILWENKTENIKRAEKIISESKADIVLFPEMSFTGFSMNTALTGERDNFTLNKMSEFSLKYKKALAFGWVKNTEDLSENHYSFIENGRLLSDYVKIHPFSYSGEDKYFKGGNSVNVFEFMDLNFSSFICYDLRFPEIFRAVSEGADIITVAANWPSKRSEHWTTLLRARAIENQCYIIGINCVGDIGGIEYKGESCVISPDGTIIKSLSDKEDSIIVEIENDVKDYREIFPVHKDKRKELYKELYL